MREDSGGSLRDQADPGQQECHKLDIVAKIRAANATRESYLPWSEYEAAADEIEHLRSAGERKSDLLERAHHLALCVFKGTTKADNERARHNAAVLANAIDHARQNERNRAALANCPAPVSQSPPASEASHPSLASAASGMRDALEKADESLLLMTMYAKAYINTAGTTLRQDAWNLAQERINEAEDARAAIAAALSKES